MYASSGNSLIRSESKSTAAGTTSPPLSTAVVPQQRREAVDQHDQDLIESLVFDRPIISSSARCRGNRPGGWASHFRLDDGNDPNYSGPYYDVYQMLDHTSAEGREQHKQYFFNTDTLLLDLVRYDIEKRWAECQS